MLGERVLMRPRMHALIDFGDDATCGVLEQARDERMNETCRSCCDQLHANGKRHSLVLEIALSDRVWMIEKPALKHDSPPLEP